MRNKTRKDTCFHAAINWWPEWNTQYFFFFFLLESNLFLEKAMAPHSSTLAWKIPRVEEPGGLQSMGLLGVGHDWATSLSLFTFMHWRRKWQPTPVLLPGESQGRGAWWAAVSGAAQSRARLKRLSSGSSHTYTCIHFSADAPPIPAATSHWAEFHVLFSRSF